MGGEPEPEVSHFVGTAAVACPKACSRLLAYGCWRRSALSLASHASTVEVEGQQCLCLSYLTAFGSKALLGERQLTFLLSSTAVPRSSALLHPTTRIQQL